MSEEDGGGRVLGNGSSFKSDALIPRHLGGWEGGPRAGNFFIRRVFNNRGRISRAAAGARARK